jgi:hypothetical protein
MLGLNTSVRVPVTAAILTAEYEWHLQCLGDLSILLLPFGSKEFYDSTLKCKKKKKKKNAEAFYKN